MELNVQPSAKDNYMRTGGYETVNYGSSTDIFLANISTSIRRITAEFNISSLPLGAILSAATLQLYYYNYLVADPVGLTTWAYKLTRTDWVELEATWNIYKTGSNWTAAGGDYVTSNPAGGSVNFPASYGWISWNVLAIVQDAYDSGIAAEFLIKYALENSGSNYVGVFYSNDYTGDTSKCPKLTITYSAFKPKIMMF